MYKISILSSMAFHKKVDVDKIYRRVLPKLPRKILNTAGNWGLQSVFLPLPKKRNNTIEVRVHPTFIPLDHPLAAVRHSFNASVP